MTSSLSLKEVPAPRKTWGARLDTVIGFFSPKRGLARQAFRQAAKLSARAYDAAGNTRLDQTWGRTSGSADSDLLDELPTIRERSRDLIRNDAHAAGIIGTFVTNDVGTGIKPQSRITPLDAKKLRLKPAQIDEIQNAAEQGWRDWIPHADAAGRNDFYEMLALADRKEFEDGEIFIMMLMLSEADAPGRPYRLALEIIEADRVETPPGKRSDRTIRSGIHIGDRGEPLGYWIRETHPGDMTLSDTKKSREYRYVPRLNKFGRLNMIHLFEQKRPGQTRGVPKFAPAMELFKDLGDYIGYEMIQAKAAGCIGMVIKTEASAFDLAELDKKKVDGAGKRIKEMQAGMVPYLGPGETIEFMDPKRPSGAFGPFVERILRAIGVALEMPYELIAKDFSRTNYSSARAALLEARRLFRQRQKRLSEKICQPVWEMLLVEMLLSGDLPVKRGFFDNESAYTRATWTGDGWEWVDPAKEVKAAVDAKAGLIRTDASIASDRGDDWEDNYYQFAREKALRKELGLEEVQPKPEVPATKEELREIIEEVLQDAAA